MGFIGDVEGGYRDLKICVVFTSATNPDLKMICEVQLILNQYLFEKKKMHKLYSVIRDEVYYRMVVKPATDETETVELQAADMKALQFEPIFNLKEDVATDYDDYQKCSVDARLGLLCTKPCTDDGDEVVVVDLANNDVIFRTHSGSGLGHGHHWITIDETPYLSVQTYANSIAFFRVDEETKTFSEDH